MITGGVLDAKEKGVPGEVKMSAEMVKAVCDKAHENGYKVAAHVESPDGVRLALENGVDSIEHGAKPDDEILRLFAERNAFLCTTLSPVSYTHLGRSETCRRNLRNDRTVFLYFRRRFRIPCGYPDDFRLLCGFDDMGQNFLKGKAFLETLYFDCGNRCGNYCPRNFRNACRITRKKMSNFRIGNCQFGNCFYKERIICYNVDVYKRQEYMVFGFAITELTTVSAIRLSHPPIDGVSV